MSRSYRSLPKRNVSLASVALSLALICGACAYWSDTGVSDGALNARSSESAFALQSGIEAGELYPGASTGASIEVKNTEAYGEHLMRLSARVKHVENEASSEAEAKAGAKCWAGWFEVIRVGGHAGSSYEPAETLPGGSSLEISVTAKMKEVAGNQDGCVGETLTLGYTVE